MDTINMSARDLTQGESEKAEILNGAGVKYALLFVTDTGLKKNIFDATESIADLLAAENIHDYDLQASGTDHKIMFPCIVLSGPEREETKVSLYRANHRGDKRFWPGRFRSFAKDSQVFALFVTNSNVVFLNLSDGFLLDVSGGSYFSEVLEGINLSADGVTETGGIVEETKVEDATSSELDEPSRFEVSSYGWDSDVEGLVKRLKRGDIKLPGFQRGFVWSPTEQSRFIESLILGLPVPNVFLAQDRDSKTLNIIDGQQRLKTLQRYLDGEFSISNSKKIHEDLRGRYFNREVAKSANSRVLDDADERTLSDSILHSIVIKSDPSSDSEEYGAEYNDAVIQIFRRLNTSGKVLQPQEVRSCIFYGVFDSSLHKLNKNESWRKLFGPEHGRYKDVETILRFLALYEDYQSYKAPMPSFLNKYMEKNRNLDAETILQFENIFEESASLLLNACGESLFKTGGTFLLSKFDAVMVGLSKSIALGSTFDSREVNSRIEQLLGNEDYIDSTAEFINDTGNVIKRVSAAIKIFEG